MITNTATTFLEYAVVVIQLDAAAFIQGQQLLKVHHLTK